MSNFQLDPDEVVLDEKDATCNLAKGKLKITLTSKKIVFEKEKGLLKKEREFVGALSLADVKYFNGEPQIRQKGSDVTIQTTWQNCTITLANILEARVFLERAKDAATGTTIVDRSSNKAKGAFNVVDDVLGMDTRETIKGVMQDGIKGALWNGIGKRK